MGYTLNTGFPNCTLIYYALTWDEEEGGRGPLADYELESGIKETIVLL